MKPNSTVAFFGLGFLLALILLANSLCGYLGISRKKVVRPANVAVFAVARTEGPVLTYASLRRNLLINAVAAIGLVGALATLGIRLRTGASGHQSEWQPEIARRLKAALLPSSRQLAIKVLDVAGDCVCARGVGGDFYDVMDTPGGPAFVLVTVSAGGLPGAFLLSTLHGAVRSAVWTDSREHHQESSSAINRLLCRQAAGERCATMFWGYFDRETNVLHYVNAGHAAPPLFHARANSVTRLETGGPALGVVRTAVYRQGTVSLDPGDILAIFSDGILDAADRHGEIFGTERLAAVVEFSRRESAHEIRNRILASVRTFSGYADPEADRTLLIVRTPLRSMENAAEHHQRNIETTTLLEAV